MRNRNRYLYNLTGLPGWMRFGYSPGWIGRSSSGVGPAAQYLLTGSWPTPQMNQAWQYGQAPYPSQPDFPIPGFGTPYDPWGAAKITPEQALYLLKTQAEELEDELYGIEQRIKEIEKDTKGEKK